MIDTFIRGLPHTFRSTPANDGTVILVTVDGEAGGKWWLHRMDDKWILSFENKSKVDASISMPSEVAWKVFTKGISPEQALPSCLITGDDALVTTVLRLVAVMA